jgi:hypothetical protein
MTVGGVLATRQGRWLVAGVVVVVAWQGWIASQASAKMPADLAAYASPRGTVNLRITLPFPPERFHTLTLQRYGRVSGTEGNTIEVRGVSVERVKGIARVYWVKQITPFRD